MKVFVPGSLETGVASVDSSEECVVDCDSLRAYPPELDAQAIEDFCRRKFKQNEVVELRWRAKSRNRDKGSFLYIAKAWIGIRHVRKIRLQCHKIREDGSIGFREIIFERHNGFIVRQ